VVFAEGKPYTARNAADEVILNKHLYRDVIVEPTPTRNKSEASHTIEKLPTGDGNSESQTGEPLNDNSPPDPPMTKKKSRELAGRQTSLGDAWKPPAEGSRRSCADKLAESAQLALEDVEFNEMIYIYAAAVISDDHEHGIDDPKSYKAATESPLAEKRDTAINEELDAISQHQVFGDFVELPEGSMALPSYWVYKIKCDGAGNVQGFKSSLLCGGNHQIEAVDYQAKYAPTGCFNHVRLALTLAVKYDVEIHQIDVCTAFLVVDLDKEIYMYPPQGNFRFGQTGSRYYDPRSKPSLTIVLRLRMSPHGLNPFSHDWSGTSKDFMISIGFVASPVDGGLFVLHDIEDHGILIATVSLYVDDLLIIASQGLIGRIKDQINERFRMHDLGSVSFYLGIDIGCNRELHTIDMHQRSYILTVLVKFRMVKSRPVAKPMAIKLHKRKSDKEASGPTIYQSMIGRVMNATTTTWPDITYAIGVLSWHNHDPSNEHKLALNTVFRYPNGTKAWRVPFIRQC